MVGEKLPPATVSSRTVSSSSRMDIINCEENQYCRSYIYKYEKHFQKMYRDVGMAVPKTTETRCRDGSVQGRHVIQRLHN